MANNISNAIITEVTSVANNLLNSLENKAISLANAAINDFVSIFGGANNLSVDSLVAYINGFANTIPLVGAESFPSFSATTSDISTSTIAYVPTVTTRQNPSDSSVSGVTNPTTRYVTPIGNEPPVPAQTSQYPYNKAYVSEGGHIKEIDDTPGSERLLDQHVTGTYQEMKASGDHVIKVIGDNYTIVAGSDHITVQGNILIHGENDCNIRTGGSINIIADGGINIVSKGALRVKAESINFESTSGDISMKSARDTIVSSAGDMNIKSQGGMITEVVGTTSMKSGQQYVIESNRISQHSLGPSLYVADDGYFVQASSDINLKAGGKIIETAASVEVGSPLNVQGQTNMLAGATPVTGQGAAGAGSGTADHHIPAKDSSGSGISNANNPDDIFMMNDDDPQAAMTAIQQGIKNGTIDPKSMIPPSPTQADNAAAGNASPTLLNSTITNLGSSPPDNLQLSPHFTLGMLSKHALASPCSVIAQHGLSVTQIVQNLQLVAANCLEPIKKQFPDMKVTSAFRAGSSNSQHERGMAADTQYSNPGQVFAYAQWIRDNVPFDQLLLEYKSTGTKLPWIHISFNGTGNRKQVLTLFNGTTYGTGLHDLGSG